MSKQRDATVRESTFDPVEVDNLLDTGGGVLDEMLTAAAEHSEHEEIERWLNERIGPYRIAEFLDRGGMSLVFRAERCDGQFEQQVAIKLLRAEASPELGESFRQERELLAGLQHPGIARIIDSGIVEGHPWIAMDLVEGEAIDVFADRNRLNVNGRLVLFIQVANAVQFAHGRLIVHRDLKPGNILVDADGQPRLLDFGIAKVLRDDAGSHATGSSMLLTPQYASPEQVLDGPVGVASDIYQLGLLLYRLLTGCTAQSIDNATPDRVRTVVLEEEPLSPSSIVETTGRHDTDRGLRIAEARSTSLAKLRRNLDGDLDAIVGKCLDKDPAKRYATVQSLIDDIAAYREVRPIQARSPSAWYSASRFAQRHRGSVFSAALTLVVLIVAVVAVGKSWRDTIASQRLALEEAKRAEQVGEFLGNMIEEADPWISAGERATTRDLLDAGLADLSVLDDQPDVQATLLFKFARAYNSMGDYPQSISAAERALAHWRRLDETEEIVRTLTLLAWSHYEAFELERMEMRINEAIDIVSENAGVDSGIKARAYLLYSTMLGARGDTAGQYATLLKIEPLLVGRDDEVARDMRRRVHWRLMNNATSRNDIAAITDLVARARPLLDGSAKTRVSESLLYQYEGYLFSLLGNHASSIEPYRQGLDMARAIFGDEHPRTGRAALLLGTGLLSLDRLSEARGYIDMGKRSFDATFGEDIDAYGFAVDSEYLLRSGDFAGARSALDTAVRLAEPDGDQPLFALLKAELWFHEQRYRLAAQALEPALEAAVLAIHPRDNDVYEASVRLALTLLNLGETGEASDRLLALLAVGEQIHADGFPGLQTAVLGLAHVAYASGDAAMATDYVDRAIALGETMDGGTFQSLFDALALKARITAVTGSDAAADSAEQAWRLAESNIANEAVHRQQAFTELAVTLARLGEHERATHLCGTATAAIRESVPDTHPFMAYTMMNCGEVDLLAGRVNKARLMLRQAQQVLSDELPGTHWRLAWLSSMHELSNGGTVDKVFAQLNEQLATTLGSDSLVERQLARLEPVLQDVLTRR